MAGIGLPGLAGGRATRPGSGKGRSISSSSIGTARDKGIGEIKTKKIIKLKSKSLCIKLMRNQNDKAQMSNPTF
jgi:hypothetical protein